MNTKYDRAPWHNSHKELPEHGGTRCICFVPYLGGVEVEMIFYRARKDSGYKDFFKECAGGRCYDWDFISHWKHYAD